MHLNKYQVVHRISEVIAQTPDPWVGLNRVTELITECVPESSCHLLAYNKGTETISLVASHGYGSDLVGKFSFGLNEGLTGLAIKTGKILNLDDQYDYPENLEFPVDSAEKRTHGLLIVPLVVGGTTIGALDLSRPAKRKFSQPLLDMIQEIAAPLAIMIVNTILTQQNQAAEELFSLRTSKRQKSTWNSGKPIKGMPITSGVVYGKALLLSEPQEVLQCRRLPKPVNTTPQAIEGEKQLYAQALERARRSCLKTAKELAQTLSEADCDIFTMHAMLLDDPTIKRNILLYLDKGHSLTVAIAASLRTFTAQYMKIEDPLLRERLYDIKDVLLNLKNAADNIRDGESEGGTGATEAKHIIVVAKELLPSQLVSLPLNSIDGIICEDGGSTSHVAILARALQKTMLVGGKGITDLVAPGDGILLDCNAGNCFVRPPLSMLRQFSQALHLTRETKSAQDGGLDEPTDCLTKDGQVVRIAGNVALLSELPAIRHYGLPEIGLYRTEFMYMIRNELPTEDEQFAILKKLVENAKVPVTIRILDAGGDKPLPYLNLWAGEDNPALGWRGLRFLLSNPQILGPQLRAILRASAYGPVRILFPMVADVFDLLKAKEALQAAEKNLAARGIPYASDYRLGIMLEIPSAVAALHTLLPHIDFVSIGTNDLVQFIFAVDRGNPAVRQWYRQCHPVVLKLIRDICREMASFPDKDVCLCGELAGSGYALPLLLGAGLRKLSMTPSRTPKIRQMISEYSIPHCEQMLDEVLATCSTEMDVMDYLRN